MRNAAAPGASRLHEDRMTRSGTPAYALRSCPMVHRTPAINSINTRTSTVHRRWRVLAAATMAAAAAALIVGAVDARVRGGKLLLSDARMIIEFNDTDQDVGIQMFIDGEPWRLLR